MRSSLFYVVLSGGWVLVLPLLQLAPSLAKLATFSTIINPCLFNLLILFAVLLNTAVAREERNSREQKSGMHAWQRLCAMVVLKLLSSPVWALFPVTVSSPWKKRTFSLLTYNLTLRPVTTAVFSTCGMGIIVFSLAAILSMPKQFITVYLGVILEQSNSGKKFKYALKCMHMDRIAGLQVPKIQKAKLSAMLSSLLHSS